MENLAEEIKDIRSRYQHSIARKVIVLSFLGICCFVAFLFRLSFYGIGAGWLSVLAIFGVFSILFLSGRLFTRSSLQSAEDLRLLDASLHLKERLITVAEFENLKEKPELYPFLIKDPALSPKEISGHMPRTFDRKTAFFAVLLLLLLLWPWPGQTRLVFSKKTDNENIQQREKPSDEELKNQESPQQGQQEGAPSSKEGSQGQDSSFQGKNPESSGKKDQSGSGDSSGASSEDKSGGSEGKPKPDGSSEVKDGSGAEGDSKPSSEKEDTSGSSQGKGSKSAEIAKGISQGKSKEMPELSATQKEQLKQDIQKLLKELSGEIQKMQEELESKQEPAKKDNPMPGTGTDPELYEDPMSNKKSDGASMLIQIDTDKELASKNKKASGSGQASQEVLDSDFSQAPEEASLSDKANPEQGVQPQAIPPEYKPVFESLSNQQQ